MRFIAEAFIFVAIFGSVSATLLGIQSEQRVITLIGIIGGIIAFVLMSEYISAVRDNAEAQGRFDSIRERRKG
jgi:hypothetical protein